jgi:hypothetical protein
LAPKSERPPSHLVCIWYTIPYDSFTTAWRQENKEKDSGSNQCAAGPSKQGFVGSAKENMLVLVSSAKSQEET